MTNGRASGFLLADVDTGLLDDGKVRRLVRSSGEAVACRALVAYVGVLLGSWSEGERLSFEDSTPLWLTDIDGLAERLMDVGLLDRDGRIPEHAWTRFYGPADERRSKRRSSGAIGGATAAARRRPSDADSDAVPNKPTNQQTNHRRASAAPKAPPPADPRPLRDIIGDFNDIIEGDER